MSFQFRSDQFSFACFLIGLTETFLVLLVLFSIIVIFGGAIITIAQCCDLCCSKLSKNQTPEQIQDLGPPTYSSLSINQLPK